MHRLHVLGAVAALKSAHTGGARGVIIRMA